MEDEFTQYTGTQIRIKVNPEMVSRAIYSVKYQIGVIQYSHTLLIRTQFNPTY